MRHKLSCEAPYHPFIHIFTVYVTQNTVNLGVGKWDGGRGGGREKLRKYLFELMR